MELKESDNNKHLWTRVHMKRVLETPIWGWKWHHKMRECWLNQRVENESLIKISFALTMTCMICVEEEKGWDPMMVF